MKLCTQCSALIDDDAKFCYQCGRKNIEQMEPQAIGVRISREKKKTPTKAKIISVISVVLMLSGLIIASFVGLKWYFSAEQRLIRALEEGNMEIALKIIEEEASVQNSSTLEEKLRKRIKLIQTDFETESIEYQEAILELNNIWKIGIEELWNEIYLVQVYVQELNDSRIAFGRAEILFDDHEYLKAITMYKQVISEDSHYEAAKVKISEAEKLYREEVLADAAAYAQTGTYLDAIAVLDAALMTLPGDTQITQQMHIYEKAYADQILADTLENASLHAETGDYLTAVTILRAYIDVYGTNTSVSSRLNDYSEDYANDVLMTAERMVHNNDYPGAIAAIQSACINVPNNVRLIDRLNEYSIHYASEIVNQSEEKLAEEDYDGAMEVVYEGLMLLPESQILRDQSKKIDDIRPKNLLDVCEPFGEGYIVYNKERTFRMAGEACTNGVTINSGDNTVMFSLNGQYTEVTFYAGHLDHVNTNMGRLLIYLDGELYASYDFYFDSPIAYVEIPVVGVKQLKIYATDNMGLNSTELGCADMIIK